MTTSDDCTLSSTMVEQLASQGLDALPMLIQTMRGAAMEAERGLRSERALTLALAEMDIQGVSTRRVAAITEQLCGVICSKR